MNKTFTFLFTALSLLLKSHTPSIIFKENRGQWPEKVLFGAEFLNTKFYVNRNSLNYCVYNAEELTSSFHGHNPKKPDVIHGHNYEVEFVNGSLENHIKSGAQSEYYNYFLGNDRSRWASKVKAYSGLEFISVFRNIDLRLYSNAMNLKYDLILKPGAKPGDIKLHYKFVDGLEIRKGDLRIKTSVGEIIEMAPYAYQLINGTQKEVKCKFQLVDENVGGFIFPEGYSTADELVIDPVIVACSYGGASVYSYNYSSVGDAAGNIYNAVGSSIGYPTTSGAFQIKGSGSEDLVVNMFNANGTNKVFATFIGGNDYEFPSEIQVANGEITVIGITSSINYPVSNSALDSTLNGMDDIFISKLDLTGSQLIASTYIGGSSREVVGQFAQTGYPSIGLEMAQDKQNNTYVVANTLSSDFPVTPGVISSSLQGTSDAVVFKMDPSLSGVIWSTYLG